MSDGLSGDILEDDLSLEYNANPICPYCRDSVRDVWEYFLNENEGDGAGTMIECGKCDKTFRTVRHIDVSYSTSKIEELNGGNG